MKLLPTMSLVAVALLHGTSLSMDNERLLQSSDISIIPAASYLIIHDHCKKPRWKVGTWHHCWKFRVEKEKIIANKCPDFHQFPEQLVAAFYDRNDKQVGNAHNFGKKKKQEIEKVARQQLDPAARPEAVIGMFGSSGMLTFLYLYDTQDELLLQFFIDGTIQRQVEKGNISLAKQEKAAISQLVDISQLRIPGIKDPAAIALQERLEKKAQENKKQH